METHGSDHLPTHVELRSFFISKGSHLAHRTNRRLFAKSMEESCVSPPDLLMFQKAVATASKNTTRELKIILKRTMVDAEYERLRAKRRQAERKYRRTKKPDDLRNARRLQKKIRRLLTKVGRQRWRMFCSTLDPRKPLSIIWKFVRNARAPSLQRYPFRALAPYLQQSDLVFAEEFCKMLTEHRRDTSPMSSSRRLHLHRETQDWTPSLLTENSKQPWHV